MLDPRKALDEDRRDVCREGVVFGELLSVAEGSVPFPASPFGVTWLCS